MSISHIKQKKPEKSISALPALKEEYHRQLLIELFNFNEIKTYETALFRVLTEFFFKFTKINALHKMALTDLESRIIQVSMKWENLIKKMTTEQASRRGFQGENKERSALLP